MRLVLHFTAGDGCTYSCDVNLPFVYESAEAAIVDFEREVTIAHKTGRGFVFAGHRLDTSDFFAYDYSKPHADALKEAKLYLPEIWTIDEWFEREGFENA